jgi:hypothetical protein
MKKFLLFVILLCPLIGWSQVTAGYHRVGKVLARAPQSVTAQVVPSATVAVTTTSTGAVATIYSDPGLTVRITNGKVTADASGNYSYYIPLNYMVTETISSPGQGNQVISNVGSNGGSSFNPASPGPIGGTTPSTGAFTTVTVGTTVITTGQPIEVVCSGHYHGAQH